MHRIATDIFWERYRNLIYKTLQSEMYTSISWFWLTMQWRLNCFIGIGFHWISMQSICNVTKKYSHPNKNNAHLKQRLSNLSVLWVVKVQHLWSQTIIIRSHLVQVHHIRVGIEHSPPPFSVHLWELNGQHFPVPLIESLRQPQRKFHLCTLGHRTHISVFSLTVHRGNMSGMFTSTLCLL